jgi:hypothetical protein
MDTSTTEAYPPGRTRGLRKGAPPGERHPLAKMTEAKVRELRQWYAEGNISMLALASMYGICPSTCREIIRRRTWKHVTDLPTKECGHCCGSGRVPA